jgi:hypothetical protein
MRPRARAKTHLPPMRAATCARAFMQMTERPHMPYSVILQKNGFAKWEMAEH